MSSKKRSNLKSVRVQHQKGHKKGSLNESSYTSLIKNEVIFKEGVFKFRHDGRDEDSKYCLYLINMTFLRPIEQVALFIDNLCSRLKDPYRWLNMLDKLMVGSRSYPIFKDCQKRIISIRGLIMVRLNLWVKLVNGSGPITVFNPKVVSKKRMKFNIKNLKVELKTMSTYRKKIRFLKKRQTEYLQEVENFKNARFVRWVDMELEILFEPKVYPGLRPKVKIKAIDLLLIDFVIACSAYGWKQHKDGKLVFDEYAKFAIDITCAAFCMNDGSLISKRILRKYMNIYLKKEQAEESLN